MAKTIAEEIRNTMNRLAEAGREQYDLVLPVENWEDNDDGRPEKRVLGINYKIVGKYRPATWGYYGGQPAEYPEIDIEEIVDITDSTSPQPITEQLPTYINQQIENAIEDDAKRKKNDYDHYDLDSRRY